jgi:hypothetical protein
VASRPVRRRSAHWEAVAAQSRFVVRQSIREVQETVYTEAAAAVGCMGLRAIAGDTEEEEPSRRFRRRVGGPVCDVVER